MMPQFSVFNRTYDETIDLMVEAKNYLAYADERERKKVDPVSGIKMSCEAMRVTSRLVQVMAWLMMQRAVQEGEITVDTAMTEENRLSNGDVCLNVGPCQECFIPMRLRSLLDRSLSLYVRISRIEEQILRRIDEEHQFTTRGSC